MYLRVFGLDRNLLKQNNFSFFHCSQANAALMYDAISVLGEAFSKMYKKKMEFLQPGINGFRANGTRDVHCATGGDFTGSPPPFEHGEKIAKFIRKVS